MLTWILEKLQILKPEPVLKRNKFIGDSLLPDLPPQEKEPIPPKPFLCFSVAIPIPFPIANETEFIEFYNATKESLLNDFPIVFARRLAIDMIYKGHGHNVKVLITPKIEQLPVDKGYLTEDETVYLLKQIRK